MNTQYINDNTPVATKNCESDDRFADIGYVFDEFCNFVDVFTEQIPCSILNGYSNEYSTAGDGGQDTFTVAMKFVVVANAHIAKIC